MDWILMAFAGMAGFCICVLSSLFDQKRRILKLEAKKPMEISELKIADKLPKVIIATYGDKEHIPTPEVMESLFLDLKRAFKRAKVIVIPYHSNIKMR